MSKAFHLEDSSIASLQICSINQNLSLEIPTVWKSVNLKTALFIIIKEYITLAPLSTYIHVGKSMIKSLTFHSHSVIIKVE